MGDDENESEMAGRRRPPSRDPDTTSLLPRRALSLLSSNRQPGERVGDVAAAQPKLLRMRRSQSDLGQASRAPEMVVPTVIAPPRTLQRRRNTLPTIRTAGSVGAFARSRRRLSVDVAASSGSAQRREKRSHAQLLVAVRWPLPPTTRLIAALFVLVTLASTRLPHGVLPAWLPLPATCAAPLTLLSDRPRPSPADVLNVALAPFLGGTSTVERAVTLANVLLLGLLEHGAASATSWPFAALAGVAWAASLVARLGLGLLFSRGTGWAYPALFFSSSVHECTSGASPRR